MSARYALALCESCDGCGTTEGDLRNRDCADCLGTGYAAPQKRILNLQSELSETRYELDSWAKQCESNMRLLKQSLDAGEEAIKQRDTLESALRSLMDEHDDFAAQYNQVKETDVYGSDSEAMEKAKQAIKLVAKGGSDE